MIPFGPLPLQMRWVLEIYSAAQTELEFRVSVRLARTLSWKAADLMIAYNLQE